MHFETGTRLMRALCGVNELSERHVRSGLNQIVKRWSQRAAERLLAAFDEGGVARVMSDEELAGIARALTYWLYTGMLPDTEGSRVSRGTEHKPAIESPEDYFESVIWRVIQAHPRALSGGYYGHWHYPPEDTNE